MFLFPIAVNHPEAWHTAAMVLEAKPTVCSLYSTTIVP